jgi:hypothetical protein
VAPAWEARLSLSEGVAALFWQAAGQNDREVGGWATGAEALVGIGACARSKWRVAGMSERGTERGKRRARDGQLAVRIAVRECISTWVCVCMTVGHAHVCSVKRRYAQGSLTGVGMYRPDSVCMTCSAQCNGRIFRARAAQGSQQHRTAPQQARMQGRSVGSTLMDRWTRRRGNAFC